MKKKKIIIPENFLEKIPVIHPDIEWKTDSDGKVTLLIENKGLMNRIMQAVFLKPKISYIHLDKFGNFVWGQIDGKQSITEIGKSVDKEFGEEAQPLYERLARYFQILESYHFIEWSEKEE